MLKKYSDEISEFSKPMIFRSPEIETYDCSIAGTYLIIEFMNKFYIITANHVLGNIEARNCVFGSFDFYKDSLPLSNKYTIHPYEKYEDDNDFCDLNIIEIDMENMQPEQKIHTKGYIIDQIFFNEMININDELLIYGYPLSHQTINYEDKEITGKMILLKGTYGGNSDFEHIGLIKNLNTDENESLNGYSGSPVYKINNTLNKKVLVGILIRGTAKSRTAYFIKNEVLKKTLSDIRIGKIKN